jgi:hypothetical protein
VLATYGAAALIIIASLLVGRAFLAVLGRQETWWLESAIGLALLIFICSVLTRISIGGLPERSELSLIVCAGLLLGSAIYLRFGFVDLPSFLMAAPVIGLVLLLASLPFIASGTLGIPGVGINNDMAAHLLWADWLQDPTGPAPNGIKIGYPLGPHGLVATISRAFGTEPLYPFLGLLLALPVITGMTALNLLHGLPPLRRTLAAALVALPYMAASTLGIAGFKELAVGLFLLCFVLALRTITKEPESRFAMIVSLGVLAAGILASFSYPGLVWPVAAFGLWAVAEVVLAAREDRLAELREGLRRLRAVLVAAGLLLLALAATQIPRLIDLRESGLVGFVRQTDSKLRYPLSPLEALGSWPSGEFLFGKDEFGLESWQLFGAIGLIALVVAMVWWVKRADLALPAGVAGAAIVWLGTYVQGGLYVQAKALAIPAVLIMMLIVGALLARQGSPARLLIAIPFVAIAAYSSFLALRDSVVAPTDRFDELKDLRGAVEGELVLSLTSDRYADYGLRGAEVFSPARNAEQRVVAVGGKDFRLPVDFDTAPSNVQNRLGYAVTPSAPYQSRPPPGWRLVESTDSYRLYRRQSRTPRIVSPAEEARPGRVFRCKNPKFIALLGRGGTAVVWPRPVIAKRLYWEPSSELAPGESASQEVKLPPGDWDLSLQYASPVTGIRIEAPGLSTDLPAGVEATIPFRPQEGPFWSVGRVHSDGGAVSFTVTADTLNRVQRLLGVDAPASIGNLTAVNGQGVRTTPVASACQLYVDHIIGAAPPRAQAGAAAEPRRE